MGFDKIVAWMGVAVILTISLSAFFLIYNNTVADMHEFYKTDKQMLDLYKTSFSIENASYNESGSVWAYTKNTGKEDIRLLNNRNSECIDVLIDNVWISHGNFSANVSDNAYDPLIWNPMEYLSIIVNQNLASGMHTLTIVECHGLKKTIEFRVERDEMIYFVPPTEDNWATINRNWTNVNITIETANLDTFKFNWNGTNYTFYDNSLVLALNLNNNSAIGETVSKAVDVSKYSNNGTCSEWVNLANLAGSFQHTPSVYAYNDSLVITAIASDNSLWALEHNGTDTINNWYSLGGTLLNGTKIIEDGTTFSVRTKGTDGRVWRRKYISIGSWEDWLSSIGILNIMGPSQATLNGIEYRVRIDTSTNELMLDRIICNWTASGKYNGAMQFDGIDDYINISSNLNLGQFAVLAWIKGAAYNITGYNHIYNDLNDVCLSVYEGNLSVYTDPGGSWHYSNTTLSADRWYHVAVVYNGSNELLYIDGILVTAFTAGGIWSYYSPSKNYISDDTYAFNGTIDEVRIYNRSLSASELWLIYQSELAKYNTSEWRFYANVTNLTEGTYSYYGWANDTLGNSGQTDSGNLRYLIYNTSIVVQFVSPTENNGTRVNRFWTETNITVTPTDGVDTVKLNWNGTTITIYSNTGPYRRELSLYNSGDALTDYQVRLVFNSSTLDNAADFFSKASESNIRFVPEVLLYQNLTSTIPYWVESWNATTQQAAVWIKVPYLLANAYTPVTMYYGGSGTSQSNGDNTFIFFDDFPGSSLNATKWTSGQYGSGYTNIAVGSGYLRITETTQNVKLYAYVATQSLYNFPMTIESRHRVASNNWHPVIGVGSPQSTTYDVTNEHSGANVRSDGSSGMPNFFVNGTNTQIQLITANTWTPFTLKLKSSYNNCTVNVTQYTNAGVFADTSDYLKIHANKWDPSRTVQYDTDWVLIRKYATVEPSATVSSERTPDYFYMRIENLSDGTYGYYGWANNSFAKSGQTDNGTTRYITVNSIWLTFVPPTENNGSSISRSWTEANVTIDSLRQLDSFRFNWNGTNYTFYDSSLILALNYNNNSEIGESPTEAADISKYGNTGVLGSGATFPNHGFETGSGTDAYNWTESAQSTRASDKPHSGNYSLKTSATSAQATVTTDYITVNPNTGYTVSGWVYKPSSFIGNVYIDFNDGNGLGGTFSDCGAAATTSDQWTYVSCSITTDASTTGVKIRTVTDGTLSGETVWFDDIRLATTSSMPQRTDGKYGNAVQFDGIDDYVEMDAPSFNTLSNWTFSTWIKPSNANALGDPGFYIYTEGNPDITFYVGIGNTGEIYVGIWNVNTAGNWITTETASGLIDRNNWNHIALTLENGTSGSGTLNIYLNGGTALTDTGQMENHSSTRYAFLGTNAGAQHGGAQSSYYYNGTIDETRMYKRALTAQEIQLHYQSEFSRYNSTEYMFYANVTNLSAGTYSYYGWANDTLGNSGQTDEVNLRYITVNSSIITFIAPTQANGSITDNNWTEINMNVGSPALLDTLKLFWNGTNITFYNMSGPYKREINIENMGDELTDYQVKLVLDSASLDNATDFYSKASSANIRFYPTTLLSGNLSSGVPYWVESWNATAQNATIWIKIPYLLSNNNTQVNMYYGGSGTSQSNGTATFIFYEDFENGLTKWNRFWAEGTSGIEGGELSLSVTGDYAYKKEGYETYSTYSTPYILEWMENYIVFTSPAGTPQSRVSYPAASLKNYVNYYGDPWNFFYHNGTEYPYTVSAGWHNNKLTVSSTNIEFFFDGSSVIYSAGTSNYEGNMSFTADQWASTSTHLHFDNVTVRKYAESEPSASVGSEKDASRFYVRIENLSDGTYGYYGWANLTTGENGQTDDGNTRYLTVNRLISFMPPTESSGTSINRDWTPANISIKTDSLDTFRFNWNGTNYTFYDSSLVLALNFNNNSAIGENASFFVDSSRYGNNGTCSGTECPDSTASGRFNRGLVYDGTEDCVSVAKTPSLNFSNGFTVMAWVKFSGLMDGGHPYAAVSMGHSFGEGSYLYGPFYLGYYSGTSYNRFYFDVWNASYERTSLFTDTDKYNSTGVWYYIAGTYNTSLSTLYVNGDAEDSWSDIGTLNRQNDYLLHIGCEEGDQYFNGTIDEVRIYNRTLSAQEILLQYQSEFAKFNSGEYMFYANVTNLSLGEYTYYGWANDTAGKNGMTDGGSPRYLIVNESMMVLFVSPTENNGSLVIQTWAEANVTVTSDYGIGTVKVNWNGTTITVYDSSGPYRRDILINNTANMSIDYQVRLDFNSSTLDNAADFFSKATASNIRFYPMLLLPANLTSGIPYWVGEWNATAQRATVWIKVPYLQENGTTQVNMYYGGAGSSQSNGTQTFAFYDDFDDGIISDWNAYTKNKDGADAATQTADTTTYKSAGYSLKLYTHSHCYSAPYDGVYAGVNKTISLETGNYSVDFDFRADIISQDTGTGYERTYIYNNATLTFYNSLSSASGIPGSTGWLSRSNATQNLTTLLLEGGSTDCAEGATWFDNVRVRKRLLSEPASSIGTEQNVSSAAFYIKIDNLTEGTYGYYGWANDTRGINGMTDDGKLRYLTISTTGLPIYFVAPTQNNATTITTNWVEANVTINTSSLDTYKFNWNGTSITFYNNMSGPYKREIQINNPVTMSVDHQVKLIFNSTTLDNVADFFSKATASNIRFYPTLLLQGNITKGAPYWVEEWNTTTQTATVWLNVPYLKENTITRINMYYGGSGTSQSNGTQTFAFYDDFDDGSISDWNAYTKYKDGADAATQTADTTTYKSAGYSLKLYTHSHCGVSPYDGVYAGVNKTISLETGNYSVDFDFRADILTQDYGTGYERTYIYNNASTVFYNSLSSASGLPGSTGWLSRSNATQNLTTLLLEGGSTDCATGATWFDNVRVRKTLPTEPTSTIGTEQNSSSSAFYVRIENLSLGTYTYYGWANDTTGMSNMTDNGNLRYLTVSTELSIYFVAPTQNNATTITTNWTEANVTIDTSIPDTFKFNWNGTNYTFYDNSLILALNFNNNSEIGEGSGTAVDISKYGNNGTCNNSVVVSDLLGILLYEPSVYAFNNRLVITAIGTDNQMWAIEHSGTSILADWYCIGGTCTTRTRLSPDGTTISSYTIGGDGNLWKRQYVSNGTWNDWVNTGAGSIEPTGPSTAVLNGITYSVRRDPSDNSTILEKLYCNWTTTGKYGSAIQFDGVDDYVNVSSFNQSSSVTIEAWIKPSVFPPVNSAWLVGSSAAYLELYDSGALVFWVYNGSEFGSVGYMISPNNWYHVAGVFVNGTHQIYVNGLSQDQAGRPGSIPPVTGLTVSNNYPPSSGYNGAFNGTIDEVRIYNRPLSADEIWLHYQTEFQKYNSTEYRFYANVTNLTSGIYTYYGWANNTEGTSDQTDNGNLRYLNVSLTGSMIYFVSPTQNNATTISTDWTEANITIDTSGLDTFKFNWNGTNYTFYNNSLILALNFNNNSAIGDSSTKAVDISRYGNNGTISGAVYDTGRYGKGLKLDGVSNYVNFGRPASLEQTSHLSVEAWIKTNDSMGLLLWRENCYRESWRMMIETGLIKAYGSASSISWDWAISGGTVSDNQWHHVAMTFDSSTGMKLYLDGMLNGSDTTTGNLKAAGEYDVHIGYTEACDIYANANYNGTVDEVRMYSRALTADEILLHYQSELSKYNSTEYRFYENVTNLTSGTYTYYGWANDTTGTNGTTDDGNLRYVTVSTTMSTTTTTIPANQFIYFMSPTQANGTSLSRNWTEVNITVNTSTNVDTFKFNWNGTNYTFYDSTLLISYNFNNYSSLGENSTKVVDISGNGYNATCSGSTCPVWTGSGKFGGAYRFDGWGSNFQATLSTTPSAGLTIEFWAALARPLTQINNLSGDMCVIDAAGYKVCFTRDGRVEASVSGNASTWALTGNPGDSSRALMVYNGSLYAGVSTTVYRFDGGTTWTSCGSPVTGSILALQVWNGSLYAGASGKVFRYDGGTSWTDCGVPSTGVNWLNALAVWNGSMYAGCGYGGGNVSRYLGGTTWEDLGAMPAGTDRTEALVVWNNTLYTGSSNASYVNVFRYDGGKTWTQVGSSPTLSGYYVRGMGVWNDRLYIGTATGTPRLYRYNGGTSWTIVAANNNVYSIASWNGSLCYGRYATAASGGGHVYCTADESTWVDTGRVAGATYVYSLAVWNGSLWAGTYNTTANKGSICVLGNGTSVYSPQISWDTNYHHIAYTVNASNMYLYIDGRLNATAQVKSNYLPKFRNPFIGKGAGGSGAGMNGLEYNGTLDEMRVYSRTLNSSEIWMHYQAEFSKYNSTTYMFYANVTNLTTGTYAYYGWANNTGGTSGQTDNANRYYTYS